MINTTQNFLAMKLMEHIVVFDGTCHFVESTFDYDLHQDDEVVFTSDDIYECDDICDELNLVV